MQWCLFGLSPIISENIAVIVTIFQFWTFRDSVGLLTPCPRKWIAVVSAVNYRRRKKEYLRERERGREGETQRERQRDRETEREREEREGEAGRGRARDRGV